MNYLPPLRNYQQMVRVVKTKNYAAHVPANNFILGNAFGSHQTNPFDKLFCNDGLSPTEQQIRTLDSMNMPSSSIRRTGHTWQGGTLSSRENATLFHKLNDSTRDYMNGMSGGLTLTRQDAHAGTKLRTELSPFADSKISYRHHDNIHHSIHDFHPAKHDSYHHRIQDANSPYKQNHTISRWSSSSDSSFNSTRTISPSRFHSSPFHSLNSKS